MSILFTRFTLLVYLSLACLPIRGENLYSLTTTFGSTAPTEGWDLASNNDGIDVYTRKKHDSDIHEAFVTTEILVPPWRINAVLADYKHHPEFMPYISETVVLRDEPTKVSVFQQLDFFPIPITDRYYTIRLNTVPDQFGTGSYRISWALENVESFIKKGRGISVPVNSGYWELRPIKNSTGTSLRYYHMADSGGWLPAWIINRAIIRVLPRMIRAVKQRTLAPQYDEFVPN
jgi:hypothetical protein